MEKDKIKEVLNLFEADDYVEARELLKEELKNTSIKVMAGREALIEIASLSVDHVVAAIVGIAGLEPVMAAIKAGNSIALANKECLVAAGSLMMQACKTSGSRLLPVDSEHNAILQIFNSNNLNNIDKITLTASGGPFLHKALHELKNITPTDAINHPTWSMGAKISVDSATMMNKGLEVIEASHLFPVAVEQIDVIIHPESIIHGLVHYNDGTVLAHMGMPDMRTPLSYCLSYPNRLQVDTPKLDLAMLKTLHFEAPNRKQFPCLKLAEDALRAGGHYPISLNAANEIAVSAFLDGQIPFTAIAEVIDATLATCDVHSINSLADVIACNDNAKISAKSIINKYVIK
jgi:1-deoxy-D-xylulose-5-phosphate reductoisomerase